MMADSPKIYRTDNLIAGAYPAQGQKTMEELIAEITTATDIELKRSNEKFPLFHSPHESYGVIAEEMQEMSDDNKELMRLFMTYFDNVCQNEATYQKVCLTSIRDTAIHMAAETCQVAAMAQKALDSMDAGYQHS